MKILCTADWHLGKKLEGYSRFDEQVQVLDEICEIAEKEQPDAVLIAGDCFDASAPPPECARLFVRTLARLSRGGGCPVLVIAGNHDSPAYLSSTEAFASQVGVMILGLPSQTPILEDASKLWKVQASAAGMLEIAFKKYDSPVRFLLSPFADARRLKKDLGIEDSELKTWHILKKMWQDNINSKALNILAAHHTFIKESSEGQLIPDAPLAEDDGERSIGGANAISLADFPEGIDYSIFGHIHRPQELYSTKTKAFYTGSALVYSLSETGQQKSLLMLEPLKKQNMRLIPLAKRADVKRLVLTSAEGLEETLRAEKNNYLEINWAAGRFLEGHERRLMETTHPRILRIVSAGAGSPPPLLKTEALKTQSISQLFTEYFAFKFNGASPSSSLRDLLTDISVQAPEPALPKKQGFLPLSLSLEGIYSYQNKTTIDFTLLGTLGLFGVFGAVGSGKSTLIEAIIYALYGETERIDKKRSSGSIYSPAYNMMNHHCDAFSIEFIFQVLGVEGKEEYKITIFAKRDKKGVSSPQRHVYRKMEGEWAPITEKSSDQQGEGEQLLGLSYNDFRKTIILQQRDFMGFLSSEPVDNAKTMRNLFRLDRFNLAENAKKLKKTFENEIFTLETHLNALKKCTPEEKERLKLDIASIQGELSTLEKTLVEARNQENALSLQIAAQKNRQSTEEELQKTQDTAASAKLRLGQSQPELARLEIQLAEIEAKELQTSERLGQLEALLEDESAPSLALLNERLARIKKLQTQSGEAYKKAGFQGTPEELTQEGLRLKELIDHIEAEIPLALAALLLKKGLACPLCGSTQHPAPFNGGRQGELKTAKLRIELLREVHQAQTALDKELAGDTLETLGQKQEELLRKNKGLALLKKEKTSLTVKRQELNAGYRQKNEELANLKNRRSSDETEHKLSSENAERLKLKLQGLPPSSQGNIQDQQAELATQIALSESGQKTFLAQRGWLEKTLLDTEKGLEDKIKLSQKQEIIQNRFDDAEILCKLFEGEGFVKYIGQKYMDQLCYSANKRFSAFTGGRFIFNAPRDAGERISLVDCHNGGAGRDLNTLSGGQSFQAALALSAALADESGAGHRFFFIDEGFGSLDAPNLEAVIDTLSALAQEEGRLIGLISHVEALQDEIPAAIFVSQGKDGSFVELREPQ